MVTGRRTWSIWSLAAFFGPVVLLIRTRRPQADNSYLWHIVAGRVQLDSGAVLTADPFSFTALGRPWRTQSWLADLGYSWAFDLWGLESGLWVPPLVGGITFSVLFVIARRQITVGPAMAVTMALTALITLPFLNPRPVIFSYLMLALTVLALRSNGLRWTLPLLGWLWASLHGSFILIFVAIGLDWIRTGDGRLIKQGLASGVVTQFTAHGFGVWSILLEFYRGNEALDRIQEWQPPDLLSIPLWPVLVALVLLAVYACRTGLVWRANFPILAWFVFGLTANRSIPAMWIALVPTLAIGASVIDERIDARARLPRLLLIGLGIASLAATLLLPRQPGLDKTRFPLEAAEHLTSDRVFHGDGVGGYLIFDAWPDRLVYVDDRAELYHDHYVAFSDATRGGSEWLDEFTKWDLDQALVSVDQPITQILLAAGWVDVYRDEHFLVLDRP